MFFNSHIDRLEDIFLRQFETQGDLILYRKHGVGASIPVTEREMEEFRLQYRKASNRWMIGGSVASVMIITTLGVLIGLEFIDEGPQFMIICLVVIGGTSVFSWRSFTAPARALERRAPVGNALSKDEWQSKHFSSTSWLLLGTTFLTSTVICIGLFAGPEFRQWPDYLWAYGSGIFSVLGARALWLKYRLSRTPN